MAKKDNSIWSLAEARESGLDRRQYLGVMSALGVSMTAGCADEDDTTGVSDGSDDDSVESPEDDQMGGELDVAIRGEVDGLDLHTVGLGTVWSVIGDNIVEKAFKMTPDADVEPYLATDLEVLEGGHQLIVHLREGVEFQPPHQREMIAEDVVANYMRVLSHDDVEFDGDLPFENPGEVGGRQPNLNWISEISIQGDYEIELILDDVNAFAENQLADRGTGIFAPENLEADEQGNHPVGTGPFLFEEWIPRDEITMSRFDDYWGEGPYVDRVNHLVIDDETVKISELENENIDLINQPAPEFIDQLEANNNTVVDWAPVDLERMHVTLNCTDHVDEGRSEHKPTMTWEIRRAIRECMDLNEYVQLVAGGYGSTASTLYPPSHPWGTEYEPFDEGRQPETANEYIAESGYDTPVEFTMLSSSDDPVNTQLGQIFVEQAQEADFDVELLEVEDAQFTTGYQRFEYDALSGQGNIGATPETMRGDRTFGRSTDPDDDPRPYHGGPNHEDYDNDAEEVLSLMEEAAATVDPDERLEVYDEAWQKLTDDCFFNMAGHRSYLRAHGSWVNGYEAYPDVFHNAYEKIWFDDGYRD